MRLPRIASVCAAIALFASSSNACGPWFAQSYLADGREDRVVEMPEGWFVVEAARIIGIPAQPEQADPESNGWDRTLNQDLTDLKQALGTTGSAALVEQYDAMRRKMKEFTSGPESEPRFADTLEDKSMPEFDMTPYDNLLTQLPREFALYARGAAAYKSNKATSAVLHWENLLDLPASERRYRSTWAAFMIGKTCVTHDPDCAGQWFEYTRSLPEEGYLDTLGLAAASWGWQARAEKDQGEFIEALKHYAEGAKATEEGEPDLVSLRWTCHAAFQKLGSAPDLMPLARDTLTRRLMSAWIVCCATGRDPVYWASLGRWEAAIQSANVDIDTTTADYLAWGAYRQGRFGDAKAWLASTRDRGMTGKWVQAKLLLRDGRVDDALRMLREIVQHLPKDETSDVYDFGDDVAPKDTAATARAEEGVILLGRQDFLSAFECFARSQYWDDTAYLAERVLTTSELERFLKTHAEDPELSSTVSHEPDTGPKLRFLLARRYARAGNWAKALGFLPEEYRPTLEDYASSLKAGGASRGSKRGRAEALYRAAMIAREYGMELMGTENEPDWFQYDGQYDRYEMATKRRFEDKSVELKTRIAAESSPPGDLELPESTFRVLSGTAAEKTRTERNAVKPERRWHYRYAASELMWECAKLLPDNDPLAAAALYLGGSWHKKTDDAYADRFYQALVRRCGKLPIGQEADKAHWFPQEEPAVPPVTYRRPKR